MRINGARLLLVYRNFRIPNDRWHYLIGKEEIKEGMNKLLDIPEGKEFIEEIEEKNKFYEKIGLGFHLYPEFKIEFIDRKSTSDLPKIVISLTLFCYRESSFTIDVVHSVSSSRFNVPTLIRPVLYKDGVEILGGYLINRMRKSLQKGKLNEYIYTHRISDESLPNITNRGSSRDSK